MTSPHWTDKSLRRIARALYPEVIADAFTTAQLNAARTAGDAARTEIVKELRFLADGRAGYIHGDDEYDQPLILQVQTIRHLAKIIGRKDGALGLLPSRLWDKYLRKHNPASQDILND